MSLRPTTNPPLLVAAAALVAVQGLMLVGYAVLEVASIDADRVTMAVTTALFFALYGVGLLACARGLTRRESWARSPVVLTQLIALGVAWGFWGGSTTAVAVALGVVAVLVLVGVFHPASLEALDPGAGDRD